MNTFQELELSQSLRKAIENMGFEKPTPIQAQAIPLALQGKDILGTAQTGTGKTAAFGIPMMEHLAKSSRGVALVLTPTRELAQQVNKTLEQLSKYMGFSSALLIGGDSMHKQVRSLQRDPQILVGTPGRIIDHLERGTLMLHAVDFLVLDETDRMLEMGFSIQLKKIASFLTKRKQTLMFSATMPKEITAIAESYLQDPERVSIGSVSNPVEKIKQSHIFVKQEEKFDRLIQHIDDNEGAMIVFAKTKHGADKLAARLYKEKISARALHGDLPQRKRERVIQGFRTKGFMVLVATDIAARGLDIPHVEHVINYDLPQSPHDYIHRIGRTARAGAEGSALSFLTRADESKWKAICRLIDPDFRKKERQSVPNRFTKKKKRFFGKPRSSENSSPNKPRRPYRGESKRNPRPSRQVSVS
ncbi:MAG: DEAD/DEAH box helicase [Bdellovibrionales bacterium]|nr:DEAD/DEAH box helicase [Bdellovibrionales bacterium]